MTRAKIEPVRDASEEQHLAAELGRFREATGYFRQRRAALTKQYPDEWVALHKREVVAHGPRLGDIDRELRRLGLHRRHVLLEFLTEEQQSLIV